MINFTKLSFQNIEKFLDISSIYLSAHDSTQSLEMPESNINKKLGMFMSCAQLLSNQRKIVQNSCRSAMLKYKSESVRYLGTVHVFILLTLTGFVTEFFKCVIVFQSYEKI